MLSFFHFVLGCGQAFSWPLHITKPDGRIPQVGDNDSGRFLKLCPVYHTMTVGEAKRRYANLATYANLPDGAIHWDEDHLDHRHIVAAINGIYHRADFAAFVGNARLETELIGQIAGATVDSYLSIRGKVGAVERYIGEQNKWQSLKRNLSAAQCRVTEIVISDGSLGGSIQQYAYPDFRLYLIRTSRFYLLLRCGAVGLNGLGAHAHNDQLAIELNVDGEDWIADPGTYLYTPLPDARNRYRSVAAHFAPHIMGGAEPGRLDLHLFSLGGSPSGHCLYFGENGFVGVHYGYGVELYRKAAVEDDRVIITGWADAPYVFDPCHSVLTRDIIPPGSVPFSPGYGIRNG